MPRRPGERYILPLKKKKGPTDFRTINPLLQQYSRAHTIWASCQAGEITKTEYALANEKLNEELRALHPSSGNETFEAPRSEEAQRIIDEAHAQESERLRLLREEISNQAAMQRMGAVVAVGAVFGLGSLGLASIASGITASPIVASAAAAGVVEAGLASPLAIAAALAGGASLQSGPNGLPRILGGKLPEGKGFAKPTFTTFSKPCDGT